MDNQLETLYLALDQAHSQGNTQDANDLATMIREYQPTENKVVENEGYKNDPNLNFIENKAVETVSDNINTIQNFQKGNNVLQFFGKSILNTLPKKTVQAMIGFESLDDDSINSGNSAPAINEIEKNKKYNELLLSVDDEEQKAAVGLYQDFKNLKDTNPYLAGFLNEAGNFIDFAQGAANAGLALAGSGSLDAASEAFQKSTGAANARIGSSTGGTDVKVGDITNKYGANKVVSALLNATPAIAEQIIGFKGSDKVVKELSNKLTTDQLEFIVKESGSIKNFANDLYSSKDKAKEISNKMAKALNSSDIKPVFDLFDKDSEIIKSAKELDIDLAPATGMIDKEAQGFINKVADSAQGGLLFLNKAEMNQMDNIIKNQFKNNERRNSGDIDSDFNLFINEKLDNNQKNTDLLFDEVDKFVDPKEEIKSLVNTKKYLNDLNDKGLSDVAEMMWNDIYINGNNPKWTVLNNARKRINAKSDKYKDKITKQQETSLASAIREDQKRYLNLKGSDKATNAFESAQLQAKKTIDYRNYTKKLLGEELDKNISSIFDTQFNKSKTPKVSDFIDTMNNIPTEFRKDLLLNSIENKITNEVGGTDLKKLSKFLNPMLKDTNSSKMLKDTLGEEQFNNFKNINIISNAIVRSSKNKNVSDNIGEAFEDNLGLIENLYNNAVIFKNKIPFIKDIGEGINSKKTRFYMKRADEILSDRNIQELAVRVGKGEDINSSGIKKLSRKIQSTPIYQKINNSLDATEKDQIKSLGLATFLTTDKKDLIDNIDSDFFEGEDGTLNIKINK